ncbi:MAG: DUF4145 domain-containing protein [Cyanobacteriota bacterium]
MQEPPFSWRCPFCDQNATITKSDFSSGFHRIDEGSRYGGLAICSEVIICPNLSCREIAVSVSLHPYGLPAGPLPVGNVSYVIGEATREWQLIPSAEMRNFPEYVPAPIIADYREACLIRHLSPKASATLARRCLQGMIRDYHGISKARLIDEIEAIKSSVDTLTWMAIDGVRSIGNIGAHMERDINVVVDVDPEEARLLLGLIETLVDDWYIARHEREKRLSRLVSVAEDKTAARKQNEIPRDRLEQNVETGASDSPLSPPPAV